MIGDEVLTYHQLRVGEVLPKIEKGAEVYFSVDKIDDSEFIIALCRNLIDCGVKSIYFSGEKKEVWNRYFELVETDRFPGRPLGEVVMSTMCKQEDLARLVESSRYEHIWFLYDTYFGDLLMKKDRR